MIDNKKKVITRFAPSPTGDPHIGNMRTALFAWLWARKNHGKFYLRIEDTDQKRYVAESAVNIIRAIEWLGLDFDGEPVYQTQRSQIYQKYARQLVEKAWAYHCFCSEDDLTKMRKEQEARGEPTVYDKRCKRLTNNEVENNLKNNKSYVIRLKMPETGTCELNDMVRGKVVFENRLVDDQVLLKSDGLPTYHLAVVVDDHEMGVNEIIRAEEWLASTPKHITLYQALGWEIPKYAHVPMILAPDKSKLSKRHGASAVFQFKKSGYLPEAIVNYLALLGWNPGDERELFSLDELVREFSLEKVQKSGAVFDINKLDWMNGHYIRQMDLGRLVEMCIPYLEEAGLVKISDLGFQISDLNNKLVDLDYIKKVVELEQERIKRLSEIGERTKYFFAKPEYDPKILVWKNSGKEDTLDRLNFLIEYLEELPEENWTRYTLEEALKKEIEENDLGTGDTLWPMRVALSGEEKSPSPFEIAGVLGKRESLARLERAVELLS